jgi:hypothetical protein
MRSPTRWVASGTSQRVPSRPILPSTLPGKHAHQSHHPLQTPPDPTSTSPATPHNPKAPDQRRAAAALRAAAAPALRGAADAALLHALAVSYRDLHVSMDLMHKKDILGVPRPLLDDPPPPAPSPSPSSPPSAAAASSSLPAPAPANRTQLFYPVRDLTRLPDRPDAGLLGIMQGRFMGSPLAYLQLLPNHLEVSYQTASSIMLWPPMEVFHPFHIDYESASQRLAAIRRRALKSGTRRRRKQRKVVVNAKSMGLMPASS